MSSTVLISISQAPEDSMMSQAHEGSTISWPSWVLSTWQPNPMSMRAWQSHDLKLKKAPWAHDSPRSLSLWRPHELELIDPCCSQKCMSSSQAQAHGVRACISFHSFIKCSSSSWKHQDLNLTGPSRSWRSWRPCEVELLLHSLASAHYAFMSLSSWRPHDLDWAHLITNVRSPLSFF